MKISSALAAVTVLAIIGLIHLYWAMGGEVGKDAAIPRLANRPVITPSATGTALVGIALWLAALLVAAAAGLVSAPIPTRLLQGGCGGLSFLLFLRAIGDFRYVGFFKRFVEGRFARMDTYLYSPLCLCLSALTSIVAWA